jgi:hypothetical protein
MNDWNGKSKYSQKTCHSATFSAINAIWPDHGSNPDRRDSKQETNHLSLSYCVAWSRS